MHGFQHKPPPKFGGDGGVLTITNFSNTGIATASSNPLSRAFLGYCSRRPGFSDSRRVLAAADGNLAALCD